jgi:MFS family permease
VYARWRGLPSRQLIVLGAGALGAGFLVMAVSPTLAVALVGAAVAGVGNGIEAVAARTALQELVEEQWMALMMSLNDSMFQCVPGAGILLGGALTALGSPRTALAVAAAGSLLVTGAAWFALAPLAAEGGLPDRGGSHRSGAEPGTAAEDPDPGPHPRAAEDTDPGPHPRAAEDTDPGPHPRDAEDTDPGPDSDEGDGPLHEPAPAPVGRHQ